MSFTALGPHNIPQMPSRPQRPMPYQKPPGFFDEFATGAGKSFGESVQKQVANHMQNSALKKALGMVNEDQSPLQQYMALAEAEPEARAQVMPFLGEERKAKREHEKAFGLKRYEHELAKETAAQSHEYKKAEEAHKQGVKAKAKGERSPEEQMHVEGVFGRIEDIVNSGHIGVANPLLSATVPIWRVMDTDFQTAEAELKPLNLEIFSTARKMENTGHLRKEETAAVEKLLIQPGDTVAQMKAKLKGLKKIFKIKGRQAGNSSEQSSDSLSSGTIIRNPQTGEQRIWDGSAFQEYNGG